MCTEVHGAANGMHASTQTLRPSELKVSDGELSVVSNRNPTTGGSTGALAVHVHHRDGHTMPHIGSLGSAQRRPKYTHCWQRYCVSIREQRPSSVRLHDAAACTCGPGRKRGASTTNARLADVPVARWAVQGALCRAAVAALVTGCS
jgi:hypothetical protein